MYFDEVYHVKTAQDFIQLKEPTDTAHPHLGKLIISLSIMAFGDHSWAWRLPSLLSGLGSIALLFLITRKLGRSFWMGFLAASLFAMDQVSATQARIAMLNAMMLFFMLLSFYLLLLSGINKTSPKQILLLLSGICLGLSFSIRLASVTMLGVFSIFFAKHFLQEKNKKAFLLSLIIYFLIVPLAIYFLSYVILLLMRGKTWLDIWNYQVNMVTYHIGLKEGHGYGSAWWGWPILARPIWYFFKRSPDFIYGIFCIGNPVIFWTLPLAMTYMLWNLLERKSFLCGFILWGFLSLWLPWLFVQRVKFFHYIYPAMPFAAMAIATVLVRIWGMGRWGRVFAILYMASATVMFFYWYPLLTGFPISEQYFQHHLWFKSWI